jgi:serine/threonine-protein kinase
MTDAGSGREPLEELVDDFVARSRRGERPSLSEYAQKHPELADEIRDLFPALAALEDARPAEGKSDAAASSAGLPFRRLGEYLIVREIGRGGMGVVYEAVQESLGRRVALKVLPGGAAAHPTQRERFRHEAKAAAGLHHTNIVPVFGVGEEGDYCFYVMQYIEGRPLDEVLAELRRLRDEANPRAGPAPDRKYPPRYREASSADVAQSLWHGRFRGDIRQGDAEAGDGDPPTKLDAAAVPPPSPSPKALGAPVSSSPLSDPHRPYAKSVAHLGVQVADALEYAAGQGVLHRDVKPSNLLLDVWGTVWLTDFGLAKAVGMPDLTGAGDLVGTLPYLAPERFQGRADVRSDVYALGLTLYELLALRPAFDDADQARLMARITSADAPGLDRVAPQLPRDLATIVHKAMAKDPPDRYQSAAALADDLRRFIDDRPIRARPVSLAEQAWRWCRRYPTAAALGAALLALLLLATGGGVWLVQQQAERRAEARRQEEALCKEVGAALAQAANFRDGSLFREGRELLLEARQRVEPAGPDDLRRQLDQGQADLDLAQRLDAARLQAATYVEFKYDCAEAERLYAAAFADAGLGQVGDDVEATAARVKASAIREALVSALDDWAACAAEKGGPVWQLQVAHRADPDPGGWRDRARDPVAWGNPAALAELARTLPAEGQSSALPLALGRRLQAVGGDAVGFLRRVQREHPADFWTNLALGNVLKQQGSGEAIAYYRVALAIRPGAAVAYYNLAEVLRFDRWFDEAIEYYQQALRMDPGNVSAHVNCGRALTELGRLDEALDHFQQAVHINSANVSAQVYLGAALKEQGRLDEALDRLRQAVALDPTNDAAQNGLRAIQIRQGHVEEVQAAWRKALETNRPEHFAWFGYAELCLFLGKEDEYHRACRDLLDRFGETTDPFTAERTGRACLLSPASEDELRRAAALADRALAPGRPEDEWARPYFLFAKGLAEYRQGRLDSAISLMQGDASRLMPPAARLVMAMAQHRRGQREEAHKTLAGAILAFDWSADQADHRDAWIYHILRREAEAMILPNLPAFLEGNYQPKDNDERIAFLGACQFQGLHCAVVHLYSDAFAADPQMAADLEAGRRRSAARFAALAAVGRGNDAQNLDDRQRARLRQRVQDWLRADLAACTWATDRALVQKTLNHWRHDADFDGVRDEDALAKLSQAEQEGWRRLWSDVAGLLQKTGGQK